MSFTNAVAPRPTKNLSWVTITLIVVLVPYCLAVVAAGFLMNFAYDGCSETARSCDFTVGSTLLYVNLAVALIAISATITGVTLRNRLERSTWWVPAIAIALMTALFLTNLALVDAATGSG